MTEGILHQHRYRVDVDWTGNRGTGTQSYRGYERSHDIRVPGKPVLAGSSDAAFRGDASRHNPEDLLVAALSSCHMLSYLHLAATSKVVVTAYSDIAEGMMETDASGGRFVEVVLRPTVTISTTSDAAKAEALHAEAHHACFIASSVNFPVHCEPRIVVEPA
ncbi:OsmC family protein [Rhodanobacter sp. MP1X3]|uniref:OsmC family protein n=1 Tax=Rhodanobacter sp. MP1X3 TaxID=2723086 RepID=UPI0016084D8B|nr:OsmC family protein [Rhodanobacter sp. MP1X3]MBB6244083.1 organic hydroperoxide reductase OsmC/OhrA [Rhodanobacter sp. MP1X3]